jgi:hypothetical protein
MPLPNLIVIGAMKCGTTSLHFQLRRHPDIAMPRDKELDFFVAARNWPKGLEWYASRFPAGTQIRGESSPSYTSSARHPGVPARMHSVIPDARLVYLVRDPVERMVSHWVNNVADGRETRPLPEAMRDEARYLDRSLYWRQISAYLEHYPPSRILVLTMEDLADRPVATLRTVLEFLDVDPGVRLPDLRLNRTQRKRARTRFGARVHRSALGRGIDALPQWMQWRTNRALYRFPPFSRPLERPALSDRDRAALAERLRDDTNRFREFAGRAFAGWRV